MGHAGSFEPVAGQTRVAMPHLARCIRHIIHGELRNAEGGSPVAPSLLRALVCHDRPGTDMDDQQIGEDGLGLDSLARISAASAVARFFDLGASGLDDHLLFEDSISGWAALVARHIEMRGEIAEIVFRTSGSTDRPKRVRKTLAELCDEVDALVSAVVPASTRRIVALPPPQHIFGFLFTVLLPSRLGVPVHDAVHRGAGSTLRRLDTGCLVIGTPLNWRALLSEDRQLPDGVSGITSAGALPRPDWDRLAAAGLQTLREIFGSTETGGLGWRADGDAPFACLPHIARRGTALTRRRTDTPIDLQDRLDWLDDDHFRPAGRLDKAIKIAGVNVSLQKVRSVLCDNALVSDAAVRPAGDRLKAFVVPKDMSMPHEELEENLHDYMRRRLDAVARPASYAFGAALPRNEMGKLTDW